MILCKVDDKSLVLENLVICPIWIEINIMLYIAVYFAQLYEPLRNVSVVVHA